MLPEEMLFDLEEAKKLTERSQENINKFIDEMTVHALKLITEIYEDRLNTMESKGFIDLNEALSRSLTNLAIKVDNVVSNNQT